MTTTQYPEEALYALLCKYLLREADAEERRWVDEWLQADAQHPRLLASMKKLLLTDIPAQPIPGAQDTDTAWQRLCAKMDAPASAAPVYELPQKRRNWWMAAAAVILLVAGAGAWWITRKGDMKTYTGPVIAQLDDGTSIQLDSLAQLQVLPGFGRNGRRVKLQGKALFDVTPDALHPFIVSLGSTTVTVMGTVFSIDNAVDKGALTIHVRSGKILVTDHVLRDSVMLTKNMLLEHNAGHTPFKVAAHVTNVTGQQLVFTDVPLREVLQTINTVYNLSVKADSALLEKPVTATFTGELPENVLEAVTFMLNAELVYTPSGILIKR